MAHQNNKRKFTHYLQNQDQQHPKKTCFPVLYGFGAEPLSPESLSKFETFLRPRVREEVERVVEAHFNRCLSSSSQLNGQNEEQVAGAGSGAVKLKLRFDNDIKSTIFIGIDIEAEKGEPLRVELCDTTNSNNTVETGPLSSALIELVALDGKFGSAQREEATDWDVTYFNKSVLTKREETRRPLMVGEDRMVRLKNGVAFIKHLSFTESSKWGTGKKLRLGARIIDDEILANYPRIGEAISNPFRVKFYREENMKRYPPKEDDEVYRLEGIAKDGEYHKRLFSNGTKTVRDFVMAHERDPRSLRKLLGKKVSNKMWNAMVNHALEYVPKIPTSDGSSGQTLKESEVHDFIDELRHKFGDHCPPLLPHGEASTSNNLNHTVENSSACPNPILPTSLDQVGAQTHVMQMDAQTHIGQQDNLGLGAIF